MLPHDELHGGDWRTPWHAYLPALGLAAAMTLAWLAHVSSGGMDLWGVSAAALAQGRYETIVLHIFAHGGAFHLFMNSAALIEIGGLVVSRLGGFPKGWLRFLTAFCLSGLSSMIFFLSLHPDGQVPLIGASGAVYGLLGLLLFIRFSEDFDPVPLRMFPAATVEFFKTNAFFLLLLLIGGGLAGLSGRMAWEAHLGGFLCGLCLGPWLTPPLALESPETFG